MSRTGTWIKFLTLCVTAGVVAGLLVFAMFFPDGFPGKARQTVIAPRQAPIDSYADAVALAQSSVTNIYSRKIIRSAPNPLLESPLLRRFFGDALRGQPQDRIASSLGSGVIINPKGHILTNHHVIANADQVLIALADGRTATARLIGSDPDTDLAVLKIDLPDLPGIILGRSENLRVGDVVLAIGNPFGVGQTVTMGIVSATGRQQGITTFEDFIQTDAAINPGNSGGALINSRGELVGINTAIFSRSGGSLGIGFAIPSRLAMEVQEQIVRYGEVIRGWLGIEVQEINRDLAESLGVKQAHGVVVSGIYRNSPAQRSGIQPGDIITHLNGKRIIDPRETMHRIAGLTPGEEVRLTVLRGGDSQEFRITTSKRPRRNSG